MRVLVLESSTTSAKAMLYQTENDSYQYKVKPYPKMPGPGTVHDAGVVFNTTVELGREVARDEQVDMIALGGVWHTVMLCNQELRPVSPVYLWTNQAPAELCARLRLDHELVQDYYRRTGCMINATYPYFQLLYLKERQDLSNVYIMGQGSYMTYRLTGERVETACMASGSGMLNIHDRVWDEFLLGKLGVRTEQLGKIVAYDKAYPLNGEGAGLLGLQPGIPVIPANSDGGLNQIGAAAMEAQTMTFSVGTSGAMRLVANHPVLPKEPSIWCYLTPKSWLSGVATAGCCNCIDWFRENIAEGKSYLDLEMKATVKSVDDPLVFLPFLFGERCPGWDDKRMGGFEGLQQQHTIGDMYLAMQEGILFNLYHGYQKLCQALGEPQTIKLSGGILHSERWKQMCADIFAKDMEIDMIPHGSLLGGAVLAMELLGILDDITDYRSPQKEIIRPDKARAGFYQKKYQRYLEYYHRCK